MVLSISLSSVSTRAQEFGYHNFGNALEALVITIDGEIKRGATDQFKNFIESEANEGYRVRLNSPGGDLREGMLLGAAIREMQLWTEVGAVEYRTGEAADRAEGVSGPVEIPGKCLSACALAFLGGDHRSPKSAEFLGFHQFYGGFNSEWLREMSADEVFRNTMSESQIISGLIVSYIIEMGVDARLFTEASKAGPSTMRTFSTEEAIAYNVVTPRGFGSFRLQPEADGILALSDRTGPTRAYDSATRLGFFCQSGRPGEAWIQIETDVQGDLHDTLRESVFNGTLSGDLIDGSSENLTIAKDHVLADSRGENKTLRWFMKINTPAIRAILKAETLDVSVDVPRAAGGYRTFNELSQDDRLMIRSAFLHCI